MTKHDDKIKLLLAKVEEQQNNLGTKPRASWQTNGIFKYPTGEYFNLNTVKEAGPLVEALAFLLSKEHLHQQAIQRLGATVPALLHNGYSVADWEKDFKKRLEILSWEDKKAQLEETKKRLNALISEDARTSMELDNIEKLLL